MDGRDMARQRASAGGRRNVVQTAHARRFLALTDTGRAFVAGESAFLMTEIGVYRSPCSPYLPS